MRTPLTGQRLREHLTYSWWKYTLLIILGAVAVNLLYTVTAYRSPAEKKVDLYIYGAADEERIGAYMAKVREEQMPDMEEMNVQILTPDETYGVMQVTTYVAAGEGDLYILPRDQFVSMASSGAWVRLEDDQELMSIMTEAGVSLQSGWRRESESGESHLYGIPTAKLPGLSKSLYQDNAYLCVLVTNGNDENVLKFLRIFCRDMLQTDGLGAEPTAETNQ